MENPIDKLNRNLFDVYQITYFKNGQRLENYYRNNRILEGNLKFFSAIDTIGNLEESKKEARITRTYDFSVPGLRNALPRCPGKIGCNLSHYYLYKDILENSPYKWHLILEDDVELINTKENIYKELNSLIRAIDENKIETNYIKLITFENFLNKQYLSRLEIPNIKNLYDKVHDWGTGAQLISNKGISIILDGRPWHFIDATINMLYPKLKSTNYKNNLIDSKGVEFFSTSFNEKKKCYGSLIYDMKSSFVEQKIGFPSKCPNVPYFMHGWFKGQDIKNEIIKTFETYKIKTLVEFGSWYGESSIFFATKCGLDKVYCVDLWSEKYISENPNIAFKNFSMLSEHPLYLTFIKNTWGTRNKIIPIKEDTCESLKLIKYLPFNPDAFFIDGEHTYEAVLKEIKEVISNFGYTLIFGTNYNNPKINKAITEIVNQHPIYSLKIVSGFYFFLEPKLTIKYVGMWADFNPESCFLKKLFPFAKFLPSSNSENFDIVLKGDYSSFDFSKFRNKPILAYSAENWFSPNKNYSLTVTFSPSQGKNIQLRNYERIYFEKFGKTDVYSNIPLNPTKKEKFCCFIVKNPNCWQRNVFFDMLNERKRVESLGSHKKNVDWRIPERNPYKNHNDYLKIMGGYRFCICFENVSSKSYLTEKLYNAMTSGAIPIYWGDPYCKEIFNPESFIYIPTCERTEQVEEFSKAIDRILYLENHPEEYNKMLNQPRVLNAFKENERVKNSLTEIKNRVSKLIISNDKVEIPQIQNRNPRFVPSISSKKKALKILFEQPSLISKIFVINLETSLYRREHIYREFNRVGIKDYEIFKASGKDDEEVQHLLMTDFVMKYPPCFRCHFNECDCENNVLIKPQVANWCSFIRIMGKIVENKYENLVMICEDDVKFSKDYKYIFNTMINPSNFKKYDIDMDKPVLIRLEQRGEIAPLNELKFITEETMSNACFLVNLKYAYAFFRNLNRIYTTSDGYIQFYICYRDYIQQFTCSPAPAYQLSRTDNEEFSTFYSEINPVGIDEYDRKRKEAHVKKIFYENYSILPFYYFNIIGLKRSGLHFITFNLMSSFDSIMYTRDFNISERKIENMKLIRNDDNRVDENIRVNLENEIRKDCKVLAFEFQDANLKSVDWSSDIYCINRYNILVLRNIFDLLSSIILLKQHKDYNVVLDKDLAFKYEQHCLEYLGKTSYLQNKICIIYDFMNDKNYVKSISSQLNGRFSNIDFYSGFERIDNPLNFKEKLNRLTENNKRLLKEFIKLNSGLVKLNEKIFTKQYIKNIQSILD